MNIRSIWVGLVALSVGITVVPVGAADTSTISVGDATVGASSITVSGLLTLGADALAPVTVSTDPQGDARVPAAGFDIGDSTIAVDFSATQPRLVVTQKIFGGMADSDGNPPFMGYSWPIKVDDGSGDPLWLAAGSKGTNFTPEEQWWTGMCTAGSDGWICEPSVPGSVTADAITWRIPFNMLAPAARAGRVVTASSAFGGTPRSFVWPSVAVTSSTAPVDTARAPDAYLIPGLVEAGIASAGTPASLVAFTGQVPFAHRTGEYSLAIPKPAAAGSYTIWVRSCTGDPEEPDCVFGTQDLTL